MVVGKIGGYLALGLIGAFLVNALARPNKQSQQVQHYLLLVRELAELVKE